MDYRGVIPAWASPMGFLLACEELSPAAIAWVLEDEARSPGDEYLWGFLGARGDPKAAGQAFQLEAVLRMLHEQARRRPSTQWRCLRGADAARVNPPTTWEQLDERRVKIGAEPACRGGGAGGAAARLPQACPCTGGEALRTMRCLTALCAGCLPARLQG